MPINYLIYKNIIVDFFGYHYYLVTEACCLMPVWSSLSIATVIQFLISERYFGGKIPSTPI